MKKIGIIALMLSLMSCTSFNQDADRSASSSMMVRPHGGRSGGGKSGRSSPRPKSSPKPKSSSKGHSSPKPKSSRKS